MDGYWQKVPRVERAKHPTFECKFPDEQVHQVHMTRVDKPVTHRINTEGVIPVLQSVYGIIVFGGSFIFYRDEPGIRFEANATEHPRLLLLGGAGLFSLQPRSPHPLWMLTLSRISERDGCPYQAGETGVWQDFAASSDTAMFSQITLGYREPGNENGGHVHTGKDPSKNPEMLGLMGGECSLHTGGGEPGVTRIDARMRSYRANVRAGTPHMVQFFSKIWIAEFRTTLFNPNSPDTEPVELSEYLSNAA